MINEPLGLMPAFVTGGLLGVMFFGGLWWTVHKGALSERPALWFLGSLLLRVGVTLAGSYLIAGDRWERLMVCLLGFVLARVFIVRRLTETSEKPKPLPKGAPHAP